MRTRQDFAAYLAEITYMDGQVGEILRVLEESGKSKDTLILFTSDNGGLLGPTHNAPLRSGKGFPYEGGIRVPMIVKWPGGGDRGTTCDVPVISTDFYPSILEMAGLPSKPKQHVDGVSITPLLRGEHKLERTAIYWHFPHYSNHGMQSPGGAIRSGNYKLLDYFENGTAQLFDLANDIGEQNDLAGTQPEVVNKLRAMLKTWRTEVSAQMPPRKR